MLKLSIYKSKGLRLTRNFSLLLIFIFLVSSINGCMHKEKIDINEPLSVKLIYPKVVEQGSLTDIKVKLTNRGLYPITIINIQIGKPDSTINYKGTKFLKSLRHKFKKGKSFNMEYFLDEKLAGRRQHVVPEVHKLKTVIYPGKSNVYTLKALVQDINNNIYKNNISISYIYLDKDWKNRIYIYKGQEKKNNKREKGIIVKELYIVENKIPKVIEGNLLASGDLGKAKYKKAKFMIKLKGWNFKGKDVESEYSIFLKGKNIWIYAFAGKSYIVKKNGNKLIIPRVSMAKPFIKAILHGKTKIHVLDKDYEKLKGEMKDYDFILKDGYFNAHLNVKQLYDFFYKIFPKGYAFHKHGEVLKIK